MSEERRHVDEGRPDVSARVPLDGDDAGNGRRQWSAPGGAGASDWDAGAIRAARTQRRRRDRWMSLISPLALLLVWELLVRVGLLDVRFFPPPSALVERFVALTAAGVIPSHVAISLQRVLLGFTAGSLPAIGLGLAMGLSPPVRKLIEPVIGALYPIPQLALIPLLMVIFGTGETFKVVTIALGTFFLVVINTLGGVVNIDPIYLDVARSFGASRRDFYLTVAWPGALPTIFTGMKMAMGVSLLLIVAAEMIGARSGIGYMIWTAHKLFDMEQMFIGLILMACFGYLFTMAINELERLVIPWKSQSDEPQG